jgi:protein-S-isoprenylcysteine O-methyltransferase Ste14
VPKGADENERRIRPGFDSLCAMEPRCHKLARVSERGPLSLWWWVKVSASIFLLAYLVVALFGDFRVAPMVSFPVVAGQAVVMVGGAIYLLNAAALQRAAEDMAAPRQLVTSGGLYGVVRHPMYLADILWTLGLAMLVGDTVTLLLWLAVIAGAVGQARVEDVWLAHRFGEAHAAWSARTRLILPILY